EAEVGGYVAAEERADDLDGLRDSVARLLGTTPGCIALTDSATRARAQFFYAVRLAPGDRILLSETEYASNAVAALQRARAHGALGEGIPANAGGELRRHALERVV